MVRELRLPKGRWAVGTGTVAERPTEGGAASGGPTTDV